MGVIAVHLLNSSQPIIQGTEDANQSEASGASTLVARFVILQ
jgi:hypothetical protein